MWKLYRHRQMPGMLSAQSDKDQKRLTLLIVILFIPTLSRRCHVVGSELRWMYEGRLRLINGNFGTTTKQKGSGRERENVPE